MTSSTRPKQHRSSDRARSSVVIAAIFAGAGVAYGLTIQFVDDGSVTVLFHGSLFDDAAWAVVAATWLMQSLFFAFMMPYTGYIQRHRSEWLGRPSARVLGLGLGLAFTAIGLPLAVVFRALSRPTSPPFFEVPQDALLAVGFSVEHFLLRVACVVGATAVFALVQSKTSMHVGHGVAFGLLVLVSGFTILGGIWVGLGGLTVCVVALIIIGWSRPRRGSLSSDKS